MYNTESGGREGLYCENISPPLAAHHLQHIGSSQDFVPSRLVRDGVQHDWYSIDWSINWLIDWYITILELVRLKLKTAGLRFDGSITGISLWRFREVMIVSYFVKWKTADII